MNIAEVREKCKSLVARIPRDVLIIGILVLASSLSFGLGLLAGQESGQTLEDSPLAAISTEEAATSTTGQVVASKNGTKYYSSNCAGANRISAGNKVWFATPAAAAAAGYAPAANCKGI